MRWLALLLIGMLTVPAAPARAADPPSTSPPRHPAAGAVREPGPEDEADVADGADDAEPGDQDLDEGRALPSEPSQSLRAPLRPPQRGQEEEAPGPGDQPPTSFGAAEPASAAQPLSPH